MVDWGARLKTRDGYEITLSPRDGWQDRTDDTRRRGYVKRPGKQDGTTYLYHEDGHVRGDGAESENDAINA